VENYLAAICAVHGYASKRDMAETARNFIGVEHRIEYFRSVNGARYYNDSIATSPVSAIACLNSFDRKVILIAGGKNKGLDYSALGMHLAEKVKILILCGETSGLIKGALLEYCEKTEQPCTVPILEFDDYPAAVNAAWENAKNGDIVVLSPASTSFDRFKNFEERGKCFKALVSALPGAE
jgi:UDP-N-acetylmuramoylalanine--D-glutamate ligase